MTLHPALSPLQPRNVTHWAMLAALVIIWGSSFALVKISVETISPTWVVALRMAIGAMVLYMAMAVRGEKLPLDARSWGWFAWFGIIGNVVPYYLITWGIQYVNSGLAGIMMACVPLFVIALAQVFLPDERLTLAKAAGFVVAFAGVAFLIGPSALGNVSGAGITLWAELAIIAGAFGFALFNVTGRYAPKVSLLARSAGALMVAAVVSTLVALAVDPSGLAQTNMRSGVAAIVLGLVSTGLMTMVLFRILAMAGASFTSLASYLVPIFASLVGITLMGESFGWNILTGLILVLCGLWLAERAFKRAG